MADVSNLRPRFVIELLLKQTTSDIIYAPGNVAVGIIFHKFSK